MNLKLTTLLLASLFLFTLACKKDAATDTEAATSEQSTTATPGQATQEGALTPEQQAEQTYARARRLSESTESGFVKNPTTTHERIASRVIRRVQTVTPLSEEQQDAILTLMKSYPESTLKGKEGKAKRQEIMDEAFKTVLTDEQRAKVEAALPEGE